MNNQVVNSSRALHSLKHTVPKSHKNIAIHMVDHIRRLGVFPANYALDLGEFIDSNGNSYIRESENRRSSRVCYSKCWYAPTYMQRKHGQKYEKVVADSGYESLATTAGSKKMGRPLSLSLTITNPVRSVPLRLRSAEWKTWATTNRMTALSARMADIWTMFQNILLTPKMVQSEKFLFTVVKTARIVLTVLSAARQKRRTEEKRFPSAGNSRKCASSLTGILPPKRESCFGATVPSRRKELSDSSSTTAASNAS